MACKLPCINDLDAQIHLAIENVAALVTHAKNGVGVNLSAWRIAFETHPTFFCSMPRELKTQAVCDVAVAVDVLNFRYVPERHRTDDTESSFRRAKAAHLNAPSVDVPPVASRADPGTQAATSEETSSTSATTPATALRSDTSAIDTTSGLVEDVEDVEGEGEGEGEGVEEEEKEDTGSIDSDSDEDWRSSGDESEEGEESENDVSASDDSASDSASDDGRCVGKKHKRPSSSTPKRRPLSYITAALSKQTVKDFEQMEKNTSTSASNQILIHQDELLSTAKRIVKVCMLSESGDTHEANQAKRQLARLIKTANRDVIEIYMRLTSHSAKPALDGAFEVDILAHGQPKAKRALWIVNLARACADAYLVATYTRGGRCIGFYGHTTGAITACRLFIDVIREVCQMAENESWALGFSNRYLEIQRNLKKARDADKKNETALVVANNEALVRQAAQKLNLMSGRKLKAGPRNMDSYRRGQTAASAYSGTAKQPRLR